MVPYKDLLSFIGAVSRQNLSSWFPAKPDILLATEDGYRPKISDCTIYEHVAKTKARMPLISHMQNVGFLMTRLIFRKTKHNLTECFNKRLTS